MMMANEVEVVCAQLVQAAELMTNPTTPREQRIEAYTKCEEFKDRSPIVVECAFVLCRRGQSDVVRIFGLKILEDSIKLRWNSMTQEQKLFIKENVMRMIESGTGDILTEMTHVKDGISRCAVEIVKREWPQHWPSLLSELNQLCNDETRTEMVMFVMLRLVEDVAVLQTLEQTQRRKEIYHALTAHMEEIFSFLLALLEKHYKAYLASQCEEAKRQCKVCQAVLNTFNAFVEWVPMTHIVANDKYLIRCLCHLLSDESLQLYAGDCLLNIVSYKQGKLNDRLQLLSLFESDMITPLFAATEAAEKKSAANYVFLKKMVQILVELGSQLCFIWGNCKETKRPPNFDIYLNALLFFTRHPSQTVNLLANELWNKFFRHAEISRDEIFITYIPKWIEAAFKKTVKTSFMSSKRPEDAARVAYSILDIETEEEYNSFFAKYRIILLDGVRLISANHSPVLPFSYIDTWLRTLLSSPVPDQAEVDAVNLLLDAVLSKAETLTPVLPQALNLLKLALDYNGTNDPLIISALLSCISSMFIAVTLTPDALLPTLNKVFSCITFGGVTAGDEIVDHNVRALRRHGCSLLVKISSKYPRTLHPLFYHLQETICNLQQQQRIGKSQFMTLVEALVLISNEDKNYSSQASFIQSISQSGVNQFKGLEPYITSPECFIEFVGLNKPAPLPGTKDPSYINRSEISYCTNFISSICRRASCPSDPNECRSGGFVISESDGVMSLRNPAGDVGISVLPLVLHLAKTLNSLWANQDKFSCDYSKALEMLDIEENTAIGTDLRSKDEQQNSTTSSEKSPLDRVKNFLFETFENVYHFLNEYCVSLGSEFYQVPQLSDALVGFIFQGVPLIPDYRLRTVLKTFLKSLVNKCPKRYFSAVLAPVLLSFCPYMLNRLTDRWKYLGSIRESSNFDEDNRDSQEVVEEVVIRLMTREYLDVIKSILTSGGGSGIKISHDDGSNNNLSLSELGSLVLQDESLGRCLVVTLLRALVWQDSSASVRACGLLELVLPTLVRTGQLGSEEASQVMISILSAIHDLGQHELNYIALTQLAIQAYEWLRPGHPAIVQVLAQVPGCNQDDLKRFDDRIMGSIQGKENMRSADRAKKDMFKKLINQFIGKDVAQMFKKEVVIKNLPTMNLLKLPRPKNPSLIDDSTKDIGITSLFNGKSSSNGQ